MSKSAKVSKNFFYFVLLNLVLVVVVATLRPVLAGVNADANADDPAVAPQVLVPTASDPPSLPPAVESSAISPFTPATTPPTAEDQSSTAQSRSNSMANKMVFDEILKAIRDSRGELEVPALNYPPLPTKAGQSNDKTRIQQLELRMKSIASLTQTSQALLKEAHSLSEAGKSSAASELLEHVQTLRSIIVQLSAEGTQSNVILPEVSGTIPPPQ